MAVSSHGKTPRPYEMAEVLKQGQGDLKPALGVCPYNWSDPLKSTAFRGRGQFAQDPAAHLGHFLVHVCLTF